MEQTRDVVNDEHVREAAEMLRADAAYIDVRSSDDIEKWCEAVDDFIYSMKRAGWTVTPPAVS